MQLIVTAEGAQVGTPCTDATVGRTVSVSQPIVWDNPTTGRHIRDCPEAWIIAAVESDSDILQIIPKPSVAVQMAAVRSCEYAIRLIADPDPEVQLFVVGRYFYDIRWIRHPTRVAQMAAVMTNPYAVVYIRNPDPDVLREALALQPDVRLALK